MRISTQPGSGVMTLSFLISVAAAMLLPAQPSLAANATWNGTTDALWSTSTNWSAIPVPGTGDTATFNNAGGAVDTIDLGGGVTVNSILFDTTNVAPYTIGAGVVSAQTLTLNNGGGVTIGATNNSYSQLISAAVVLGTDGSTQNFTLTNNSGRNLALFGNITGSTGAGVKTLTISSSGSGNTVVSNSMGTGGVIADGAGGGQVKVVVNNTGTGITAFNGFNVNTFTGGLHIQAGTLATTAGNATFGDPANVITLGNNTGSANTTLISGRNSATAFANPITIAGGNTGVATISSTGNTTFGGTLTLGNGDGAHNLTLLSNSGVLTIGGDIAGTGNLTLDMGVFTQIALSGASINPTGTITSKGNVYIANDAIISGNIGSAVQGVIQDSATVELNLRGANTYTAATTINRGTINLGNGTVGSLNGTTGTALIFNGTGAFNVSEASGVSQGMGALTVNDGEATLRSQNNGGNSFLTFASLDPLGAGATINFTTNGGSAATNKISLTNTANAPLTTTSNDPGMFFNGSAYARYSIANSAFQAVVYGTDSNANPQVANGGGTVAAGPVTLGTISAITDVQFLGGQGVGAPAQSTANGSGTNSTTLVVQPGEGVRFAVGAPVTGTGITANTWITAISGDTLTLSRPSTWANAAPIRPNYLVTGQTTGDVNSVNLLGNGASGALRLAAGETLGINGVLVSGAANNHVSVISGGTAIQPAISGGELVVRNNTTNDRLEINSVIQNNTTASGLTKSGPGQTTLSGANTYTGTTTINAGVLTADNSQALGVGGSITFSGGSHATDIANLATSGVLQYTANSNSQDFSARFKNSTGAVLLDTNGLGVTLASAIDSSNTGGLMITNSTGTGTMTLSGANTFTGDTTLLGGGTLTLNVNHDSALGTGTFLIRANGAAPTIDNTSGATRTISNAQVWDSNFTFTGTNNLTMTGPVTINGNRAVTVTDGTLEVDGNIGQSGGRTMTKAGAGTLVFNGANSYTGTTTIQAGTVSINSIKNFPLVANAGGEPSSLGAPVNTANGTIGIGTSTNAATLRYTGTGDTTNRVINQGGSTVGATLDQSGTGLLTFTGNVTASGGGSKTLTLQGSTAGRGEIAGIISNNSGANLTSLTKAGTGTWTLSGTNTYTGVTNVDNGTLLVNGNNSAATGNVTVAAIATLGGYGTIGGITNILGTHSPGASPGIQTFLNNLSYSGGVSEVDWELIDNTVVNAPDPTALFDTIEVGGNLDFAALTSLNLIFNSLTSDVEWTDTFWSSSHLGTSGWLLYDVAGTTSNFGNLSLTTTNWQDSNAALFNTARPGSSFTLVQDGQDIYLNYIAEVDPEVVPEPGSMALALLGFMGLGAIAWRNSFVCRACPVD